jgi:hypothetical protein
MSKLEKQIEVLVQYGLYNICYRNAGWAVMFYEPEKDLHCNYKEGLVVYAYYSTLAEAVQAEGERLIQKGIL